MVCPANGGFVAPGSIKVSAQVKDTTGVLRVEFYSGVQLIGQVQTAQAVGGANDLVRCIAVQPDGKIVVGGDFVHLNGVSRNRIVRLLPSDGSLDTNFRRGPGDDLSQYGPNGRVRAVAIEPNGLIDIGGEFTTYGYDQNGVTLIPGRGHVARIGGL